MGTRSMHIYPSIDDSYHGQYLQFDGYPSNQIGRILSELKLLYKLVEKDTPLKFKFDYLECYYNFRAYDSTHSLKCNDSLYNFNKHDPDNLPDLILKKLETMWVEYLYQWIIDLEEPELRITHIKTGNVVKLKIKELVAVTNNSITLPNGKSVMQNIEEFSEKVEADLESLEESGIK